MDNDELEYIRAKVTSNLKDGKDQYAGLTSSEIGRLSRAAMFGDNDEAFPDEAEWSAWTD